MVKSRFSRWGVLLLGILSLPLSAEELINASLKPDANNSLPGWVLLAPENPYSIDPDENGNNIIKGTCRGPRSSAFGLKQVVKYDSPSTAPIVFSGWSRSEDVVRGGDYCIYLDILHSDNTMTWAVRAVWEPGSQPWTRAYFCLRPKKPVKEIRFYVLLRNAAGIAWFRDLSLKRCEPEIQLAYSSVLSMTPRYPNRYCVRYAFFTKNIRSECTLLDRNKVPVAHFTASGNGIRRELDCSARPVSMQIKASDAQSAKVFAMAIPVIEVPAKLVNGQSVQVWTADSMDKVSPLTFPDKKSGKSVNLDLAGNEYESCQIQISNVSHQVLSDVSLKISPLKNKDGKSFPGSLQWERIAYIPRTIPFAVHPEALPDAVFWLPDPLLPAAPFTVPTGATQGTWLTVHVERNAFPGEYLGEIDVMKGTDTLEKIPVKITVFPFSLPDTFRYQSAFALMDGFLDHYYPGDLKKQRRASWDIMLDHRLNPNDITRTEPPPIGELKYARDRGMNRFNILNLVPKPSQKVLWTLCAPVEAYNDELFEEFKMRLDPYVAELKKNGLDKLAYFYGFDERGENYFPTIARVHKFLSERYSGIPLMTTSAEYKELTKNPFRTDCESVDWYCPTTVTYQPELSAKLRAKGHRVWWYTCCGPFFPYANFASLEYPFYEGRLIAWMTYFQQADGFLFWHVNNWMKRKVYLKDSTTYQTDFRSATVSGATGDGQFLYPGEKGPLPSIRLANLRDGSEDYDYLSMLTEKSPETAMELSGILVPELTSFERNPAKIRKVRRQVAEKIAIRKKLTKSVKNGK
ncbi:MAG: DUF4091 domain-containing protein [Victivallales bacterium]|nr:DUF4091 domain-containing protein [Victivallales bacterium]